MRAASFTLVVVGLGLLAWACLTFAGSGEPVTGAIYERHQDNLAREYEADPTPPPRPKRGEVVGKLIIPRLELRAFIVWGTDKATLKKGPGIHPATSLPGQGHLSYIAGHRTTYGAPFWSLNELRRGDPIIVKTGGRTLTYRVTTPLVVEPTATWVLRDGGTDLLVLQTCTPRYSAAQRLLVYAKPDQDTPAA